MPKPTLEFIPSPHCAKRRRPAHAPPHAPSPYIDAIVIHYTASLSIEGTLGWFRDPVSKVSAHYVIGRDGRLVQMVPDDMSAWHAGRSAMFPNEKPPRQTNVNDFSIGIELVGTPDSGFTDRQLASLYELLAQLVRLYKIPPERVVGHLHVSPGRKIDPDGYAKQFNWSKTLQVCRAAYPPLSAAPTSPPAGP